MGAKTNRQWRLAVRPSGLIKEADFEWREEPVPTPGENEFLVRNIYLSLDPANRGWIREAKSYIPPVTIGEVSSLATPTFRPVMSFRESWAGRIMR
jgi:NADPH-dependent curcumin reductase CurA